MNERGHQSSGLLNSTQTVPIMRQGVGNNIEALANQGGVYNNT